MTANVLRRLARRLARLRPKMEGFLDGIDNGILGGWAIDVRNPDTPVIVSIRYRGEIVASLPANQFREDLRRAAIGNGRGTYGFSWTIPDSIRAEGRYALAVSANGIALSQSPVNAVEDWTRPFGTTGDSVRDFLTGQYCTGSGLELGALFKPAKLEPGATVRYVDHYPAEVLRARYPDDAQGQTLVPVDIVTDGNTLQGIPDSSADFFIANQVLEHLENPLLAVGHMLRVLRPGGMLVLSLPDKRHTFDAARPVTPFSHLLEDFTRGPEHSREAHYREWMEKVEKVETPDTAARLEFLMNASRYPIHFHVWTAAEMLEMFLRARDVLDSAYEIECFKANGAEAITVLRKL